MADDILIFCGTQRRFGFFDQIVAAWRKRKLTYSIAGNLPGVPAALFAGTVADAFGVWAAATPLTFTQITGNTDIVITTGPIDGAGNVLAWSELPDGSDRQLTQKYDSGDRYTVSAAPPRGSIDLLAVLIHEIGHALGLEHAPQSSSDIMAPIYKAGLRSLQPGDVSRIQRLYGPRVAPPAPPPSPPAPTDNLIITLNVDLATRTAVVIGVV